MTTGISTACFYPDFTEEAMKKICNGSVESVEVFTNCDMELAPDYLRNLRQMADSAGTKVVSVHPYTSEMESMLFFSQYKRRFQQGRDYYKKYYEAANILGAEIIVFHGAFTHYPMSRELYVERYGALLEDAAAAGVALCHENVSRCVGKSPDFFAGLIEALPDAGVVLDIKQAVRSGVDIMDFVSILGNRIRHIHISDHNGDDDCLSPGTGTFNSNKFISSMYECGFNGAVIVELYRDNFHNIVELFTGYQHVLAEVSTFT